MARVRVTRDLAFRGEGDQPLVLPAGEVLELVPATEQDVLAALQRCDGAAVAAHGDRPALRGWINRDHGQEVLVVWSGRVRILGGPDVQHLPEGTPLPVAAPDAPQPAATVVRHAFL